MAPNAFIREPQEQMQMSLQTYGFKKPLILGGSTKDRTSSCKTFKMIDMALKQFRKCVDKSISEFNEENDEETTEFKNFNEIELVKTALASNFLSKYETEIENFDTADKLVTFLKSVVGTVSEVQKQQNARKELMEASRRIDEEESFSMFHTRLENLTKLCDSNAAVQTFLLKDAFGKNLNSDIKQFLREHNKTGITPKEMAEYLDKMQKHKKSARVNEIQIEENNAFQNELMNRLEMQSKAMAEQSQMMAALTAKIAELSTQNNEFTTQTSDLRAEIFKLKTTSKTNRPRKSNNSDSSNWRNTENSAENSAEKTLPAQPKPWFKRQNWGNSIHCRKCGLKNHTDENCVFNPQLQCFRCNGNGHIATVCRKSLN